MFHACVERFDVTGTVGKFLGTKRGLRLAGFLTQCPADAAVPSSAYTVGTPADMLLPQIARRALQMTNRSPRAPGAAATRGATPLRAMGYKYRVAARRLFHRSPTVLSRTQATAHKSHELPGPVWHREPAPLLPSYSSRCCSRAPP